jgi:hypothetical protein
MDPAHHLLPTSGEGERRSMSPSDMFASPIAPHEYLNVEYDFPDDLASEYREEYDPADYIPKWPRYEVSFSIDLTEGASWMVPLRAGQRMTSK